MDTVGARIIKAKRRANFGEDRALNPQAHHIDFADTRYTLGNADPAKIDLVRLGHAEGSLI